MTHIIYRHINIYLHLNGKKEIIRVYRRKGLLFTELEPKAMYRHFTTMPALRLFLRDIEATDIINDAYRYKGGKLWIDERDIENEMPFWKMDYRYWLKPEHYTDENFSATVKVVEEAMDKEIELWQLKEFPALQVAQFFKDHGYNYYPIFKS